MGLRSVRSRRRGGQARRRRRRGPHGPWAYNLQKTYDLVKIADTQTGVYEGRVCCVLGANGPFLEANKDAVRRIATANLAIHEYTAAHPDEVAQWYFDNLKPGMPAEALARRPRLAGVPQPSGRQGAGRADPGSYEDLKLTKVIDPDTDAAEIAQRVTVDILAASSGSRARPRENRVDDGRCHRASEQHDAAVRGTDSSTDGSVSAVWTTGLVAAVAWAAARRDHVALPDVVKWGSTQTVRRPRRRSARCCSPPCRSLVHRLGRAGRVLRPLWPLVRRDRRLVRAVGADHRKARLAAKALLLAAAGAAQRLCGRLGRGCSPASATRCGSGCSASARASLVGYVLGVALGWSAG